jgi:hypothetical protein
VHEAEWLACADPTPMLKFLRGNVSDRKLRLFACACCRTIWKSVTDAIREAVTVWERFADGLATRDELSMATQEVISSAERVRVNSQGGNPPVQASLFRCIFGNPFRPSPPLPPAVLAWNDRTILRLAEAIYEDRQMPAGTLDPGRLGILADALLDAGCNDEDLIQHCRSDGPHARGCWAVDLILGRQ